MEAFSHFITTDDCTAHSCRRRGRRGCLSRTPTLFFFFPFPSLYFPQKETKKGSVNALRMYVKYHVENDFIPRFPSLLLNFIKTTNSSGSQTVCWLPDPRSLRSEQEKLRVPEQQWPLDVASGKVWSCVPSQGSAPDFPEPVFLPLSKPSVPPLKHIPARLIKGKKRGVLDDWD